MDELYRFLRDPSLTNVGAYLGYNDKQIDQEADKKAVLLFQHCGVLPTSVSATPTCNFLLDNGASCGLTMKTCMDSSQPLLGFRYMCFGGEHRHRKYSAHPTSNTLFDGKKLPASKVLRLIVSYLEQQTVAEAEESCKVSHRIAVSWYQTFREVAYKTAWHDFQPIGGVGHVVELDESSLWHRKHHTGRPLATEAHWAFGAIDRINHKRFAILVDDRKRDTLIPIMARFILPDTYIFTDGWRAYAECELDLPIAGHGTVIHKTNFLCPPKHEPPLWISEHHMLPGAIDKKFVGPYPEGLVPFRVHTQTCERMWRSLKHPFNPNGKITKLRLDHHAGAWMYLENILKRLISKEERFRQFLVDIARVYPGFGVKPIESRHFTPCHCNTCQ